MKKISLQWRITLMTAILIGITCVSMISALRKKLRTSLGYDPIRNRIGEGYVMGEEE